MKMIWIIFKKEFLGFFKSPLFYLIAFLSTILLSITFSMGLQNFAMTQSNSMFQMGISSQQMNIHYAVFLQHLVGVFHQPGILCLPAMQYQFLDRSRRLPGQTHAHRGFSIFQHCGLRTVQAFGVGGVGGHAGRQKFG